MQGGYLLGKRAVAGLDDGLGLVVVKAVVGLDDGAAEPALLDHSCRCDVKYCRETELFLARSQGAQVVREFLGKHGHGAVHQVDRGAALVCALVDDGAGGYIVSHVGDMHADLYVAVLELAIREGVVEVLGIGRVNSESRHLAEIPALGNVLGGYLVRHGLGCGLHLGLEAVGQTVLGQDGVHLGVVGTRLAQYVYDAACRSRSLPRPVGHDDGGLQARHVAGLPGPLRDFPAVGFYVFGLCSGTVLTIDAVEYSAFAEPAVYLLDRYADIVWHIAALHDQPGLAARYLQYSDMRLGRTLEHCDYLTLDTLGLTIRTDALGLGRQHFDYITVESPTHLVLRHEHIIVPVRHLHKAVTLAGHAHRTRQFLFDKTFLLAFGFPLAAPMLFLLQIHLFLYRLTLRRLVPVTPAAGTGGRSFLSTHTLNSIIRGQR